MIRPDFDPRIAQDATTAEEAMELARAWADGRRSWWNQTLELEPRDRLGPIEGARQRSLVAADERDAAEVAKWAALVHAFLAIEAAERRVEMDQRVLDATMDSLRAP